MDEYTKKRIEREKNKKINEMIASELADEIIPESDVEAARELCLEYGRRDTEYLVGGAILTCDKATIGPNTVGEETINFLSDPNGKERKRTRLKVSENATELNGGKAATVKDHQIDINIAPFECNCKTLLTEEEKQKIINSLEECEIHGTCRKLMKLNDDWENMIKKTNYFSFNYTNENQETEEAEGITMLSMLFCSHGGLITLVTSGQRRYYKQRDKEEDIAEGLYTDEDFEHLVATLAGEANSYRGMVAVGYEILNRCKRDGKSIKEVVSPKGQYTGFKKEHLGKISDENAIDAAIAVLRNEVENPIGNITNHFGRYEGYDLWYEKNACTDLIIINGNVFYEPYGAVHNKKATKTADAIVIYDSAKRKWLYDGVVKTS